MRPFLRTVLLGALFLAGCDQAKELADSAQKKVSDLTAAKPEEAATPAVTPPVDPAPPATVPPAVVETPPPPKPRDPEELVAEFIGITPALRRDAQFTLLDGLPAAALAKIEEIKVMSSEVTEAGLAVIPQFPNLKRLSLEKMPVSPAMLKFVALVPTLQELSLDQAQLTDDAVLELAPLSGLTLLNLRLTAVTDRGAAVLPQLTALEDLNLAQTKVTGASLLGKPKPAGLRVLNVADSEFGAGLPWIKGITTLEELNAYGAPVNDKNLAQAGGWPNLKILNLYGAHGVTDTGFAAGLKGSRQLVRVTLSKTQVSNRTLGVLQHCKQLEELSVQETQVNEQGGNALQKILPKITILR